MAMSPTVVCNNILIRAFDEKIDVTPMKLQKLLYFTACEYLKKTDHELFSEKFSVWQYGPVLQTVYDEFRAYRSSNIKTYATDAMGKAYRINEQDAPNLKRAIDSVWKSFRHFNGIELSKITHEDGSAWTKAFQRKATELSTEDMREDQSYESRMRG